LKSSDSSREETKHRDLLDWLTRFAFGHKSVFGPSANYEDYHEQAARKNSENKVLPAYGGLTRVSHRKIISYEASNSTRRKWTSGGSDITLLIGEAMASLMLKTLRAASYCSWTSAW
jgi:hypothetical protein